MQGGDTLIDSLLPSAITIKIKVNGKLQIFAIVNVQIDLGQGKYGAKT